MTRQVAWCVVLVAMPSCSALAQNGRIEGIVIGEDGEPHRGGAGDLVKIFGRYPEASISQDGRYRLILPYSLRKFRLVLVIAGRERSVVEDVTPGPLSLGALQVNFDLRSSREKLEPLDRDGIRVINGRRIGGDELVDQLTKPAGVDSLFLQLNGEIPQEIGRFKDLQVLDIDVDGVGHALGRNPVAVPVEIGKLVALHTLNLRLGSSGFSDDSTLPPEIGRLKNLRHLHIGCGTSIVLPREIGLLTELRTLRLVTGGRIAGDVDALGQLSKLEVLVLRGTASGAIPESITELPRLRILRFRPATSALMRLGTGRPPNVPTPQQRSISLPDGISRMKSLELLDLSEAAVPLSVKLRIRETFPKRITVLLPKD